MALVEGPEIWKNREFTRAPEPPDNDGMEARVAKLEQFAADARERLARIETKLDAIAADTSQWKWLLIGAVLTIVLAVVATGISIQQMTVSTFQAAGQHAQQPSQPIIINVPPGPSPQSSAPTR